MNVNFKLPKNDGKYHWTSHVARKIAFYGLSPDRIKRVIRNPKRVEDGVAENTVAVMQPGANIKKPSEVWVMYQPVRQRTAGLKLKARKENYYFRVDIPRSQPHWQANPDSSRNSGRT